MSSTIPVTIITGFLGSGKTTLLLNLLPQLITKNPDYKLALLKNEFGDLAIDSQLASSSSISGVREILNGCICCNLIGSLSTALEELASSVSPDRIVIETSGSAFPATLAMEVNRLARNTNGKYVLDGVVTVIDVENWKGYEDTSFTARLQARYMDLVIFNKWEEVDEKRWEECLDRLGDMEIEIAWVKSQKGWVDMNVVFGLDRGLVRGLEKYQSEVEVLSVTLSSERQAESESSLVSSSLSLVSSPKLDTVAFLKFLQTAPRDEIYRIKAIFTSPLPIPSSDSLEPFESTTNSNTNQSRYILNWSFGRWTCTAFGPINPQSTSAITEHPSSLDIGQGEIFLRMVIILSRGLGKKWKRRLEDGSIVRFDDPNGADKPRVIFIK